MLTFEWILLLLFAAVVLTNLAQRLAVPYPSLLAIAGTGLAFLPFAPQFRIEPELVLALFVAPALLDAAFDTSPRDLRAKPATICASLSARRVPTKFQPNSNRSRTLRTVFRARMGIAAGFEQPLAQGPTASRLTTWPSGGR